MKKLILLISLLFSTSTFAATGDILYQNCASDSCTGAGSANGWVRTVETTGCYSGSCLKLVGSFNSGSIYGAGNTSISTGSAVNGKNSITMAQWVKFSENHITGGNMKMFRPYSGSSGGYYGSPIIPWYIAIGADWTFSHCIGDLIPYAMDPLDENDTWIGDQRYLIADPESPGDFYWTTQASGDITAANWGEFSNWNHFRVWFKLPTSIGGSDGEMKMWVNDTLIFHAHNVQATDPGVTTTFSSANFMPSSEAYEPFTHWVDEMIIYEGYVPPSASGEPVLSSPIPNSILSYGTEQTTLGITTDTSSTCKYSTTPNVAYASMANTFSSTGGTTHTQTLTGLTNGQNVPYYIKCSNGAANTYDYQINVAVADVTCAQNAAYCDLEADCTTYWPTYYWWNNTCNDLPIPENGTISQSGVGTIIQSGSGTLSQ